MVVGVGMVGVALSAATDGSGGDGSYACGSLARLSGSPMSTPNATNEVPVPDDTSIDLKLPTITDEFMKQRLSLSQSYTLLLLKKTPKLKRPEVDPIIWEHGRRNMALQQAGLMPIVCPVKDESEWAGIGILTVPPERAAEIITEDPGVKAGIFTFEVHPVASVPGATLPSASRANAQGQAPSPPDG